MADYFGGRSDWPGFNRECVSGDLSGRRHGKGAEGRAGCLAKTCREERCFIAYSGISTAVAMNMEGSIGTIAAGQAGRIWFCWNRGNVVDGFFLRRRCGETQGDVDYGGGEMVWRAKVRGRVHLDSCSSRNSDLKSGTGWEPFGLLPEAGLDETKVAGEPPDTRGMGATRHRRCPKFINHERARKVHERRLATKRFLHLASRPS